MGKRWLSILLLSTACSASPSINVGSERDAAVAGSGGAAGASGFGGVGGFGGDNALTAKVTEPPSEMAIEVVVIGCAGECKQVLAIASGGNDPYTFAWSDGVTTAARQICATDDATFTVQVTDTAVNGDEFTYDAHTVDAHTVSAAVTAAVLQCNDAGVPVDAGHVGDGAVETCGEGFKPGVYEGTFMQTLGPLSGMHQLYLAKATASANQETISGTLDNQLNGAATMAKVTFGSGSFYDCTIGRLFLSGVRTEPGAIPIPYTYEATYDAATDSFEGPWASAAPPSPGVYPTSALDNGTWNAHWVRP